MKKKSVKAGQPKQSLQALIDRARASRAQMGEEKWLEYRLNESQKMAESIKRHREWFEEYRKSPECQARDKLEEELKRLKEDATIRQSETCVEILDAFLHCIVYRWSLPDSAGVLQPIGDEFKRLSNKKAADIRHSMPGGARKKTEQIRAIWASGKYDSRDLCAEQECAALEMSFSSARKALRGMPDPK